MVNILIRRLWRKTLAVYCFKKYPLPTCLCRRSRHVHIHQIAVTLRKRFQHGENVWLAGAPKAVHIFFSNTSNPLNTLAMLESVGRSFIEITFVPTVFTPI